MHTEQVEFKNDSGIVLRGVLHHALGAPRAIALFAHCFTCTAKSKAAVTVSRRLATHGITVLRFDFTGLGESSGEFADSNFSTSVADIVAAAAFMEGRFGRIDLALGHSLGGTAVLAAATEHARFAAVVTIAAPARAEHVKRLLGEAPQGSESVPVNLGGRSFSIKRQFFDDLAEQPAPSFIRKLRAALLVMHAPLDDVVEIENASEIFLHAVHPKSFVTLDDANHLLTNDADAEYAADVIVAWSSRYLPAAARSADAEWVTATTGSEGFTTALEAAGHTLIGDEPTDVGGSDLGPSPYDYLGVALASCTSMTLQMYARHKKLDLRAATTRVRHRKIHAVDCAECETKDGRIDELEREIELDGDLDEATRRRMLEIADRCPVHKTLLAEIRIVTRTRP
jgi:uncharacterized OsmC-like protein/alpha-beta hydrolase superfamily lysophospholipase